MEYKRPKYNNNINKTAEVIHSTTENMIDPDTQILIPYTYSYIEMLDFDANGTLSKKLHSTTFYEQVNGTQKLRVKIEQENFAIAQEHLKYIKVQQNCVTVAEETNDMLKSFLANYYLKTKNIAATPFMDDFAFLRKQLSEILTNEKSFHLKQLSTGQQRKEFRRLFAEFIEDRNIYTHGKLHVRINDLALIIRYDDRKKGYVTKIVDSEIMQSFLSVSIYLKERINLMYSLCHDFKENNFFELECLKAKTK
ncbi:MAG: hypothetical protein ABI861_13035 [Panacibacter sp.]